MNNPIEVLIKEHNIIESVINTAKQIQSFAEKNPEKYFSLTRKLIDFFRNYADEYHHFKEESLLFPKLCDQNELLRIGIVKEMLDNHDEFRIKIRQIESALDKKDLADLNRLFNEYFNILLDHIAVENEELFQMTDTLLTKDELEKMYYNFLDTDRELGRSRKKEWEDFASKTLKEVAASGFILEQ